ncbi:MAG: TraX family protein [bacterium]|nr:TraX family protein [bacterium]
MSFFMKARPALSKETAGLSRDTLKKLALFTMLLDHIGVVVLYPWISIRRDIMTVTQQQFWNLSYFSLRTIGRIAFPIFAFFLVEGFFYTRDKKRYFMRLFGMALLSEIPFNLAVSDSFFMPSHQNTLFTLALGLLLLECLSRWRAPNVLQMCLLVLFALAAIVLRLDYAAYGIVLIVIFYWFHADKKACMSFGAVLSFADSMRNLGAAALAYIPLSLYDRKKQPNKKGAWMFYVFYPAHLLVLYGIRLLVCKPA